MSGCCSLVCIETQRDQLVVTSTRVFLLLQNSLLLMDLCLNNSQNSTTTSETSHCNMLSDSFFISINYQAVTIVINFKRVFQYQTVGFFLNFQKRSKMGI